MEPKFAAAQYTLGLAYEQMGMTEEAIVELHNARTCAGNQPAVMAALAHVYSTAGKSIEAAETSQSLQDLSGKGMFRPTGMPSCMPAPEIGKARWAGWRRPARSAMSGLPGCK